VNAELCDWLKTRPESVQKLAMEFPLGTEVAVNGEHLYLLGWTEGDSLIMSKIDPSEDYDAAYDARTYLCAQHCRGM
jgi:hypothetical protein